MHAAAFANTWTNQNGAGDPTFADKFGDAWGHWWGFAEALVRERGVRTPQAALVKALNAHAKEEGVQQWGSRALSNITYGKGAQPSKWREEAKTCGARPQWLVGVAEAMEAVAVQRANGAGSSKTERVAIRAPQPRASSTARAASPAKRAPRVAPKQSGVGGMVALPDAGPLWR